MGKLAVALITLLVVAAAARADDTTDKAEQTFQRAATYTQEQRAHEQAVAKGGKNKKKLAKHAAEAKDAADKAYALYQQLVKDYPESSRVPDAMVAIGDHHFEAGDLTSAVDAYKVALQYPKSDVYTSALHKIGRVYASQQKTTEAFEVFFKVSELTKDDTTLQVLHDAAQADLVRAYADMGKVEMAYKVFVRVDKSNALAMLEQLGGVYVDQGKPDRAIYVFRELQTIDPDHARVCEWEAKVVVATPDDQKLDELKTMAAIARCHDAAVKTVYEYLVALKKALAVTPGTKPELEVDKDFDAIPEPQEIPAEEQRLIAGIDLYLEIADATDPEVPGIELVKGNLLRRHDHLDEAIVLFVDLLEHHRDHEVALYAANLLLDALNRLKRYDEMIAWVDKLLAEPKWLEEKEELAELLDDLKRTSMRKDAEACAERARDRADLATYDRCAELYVALYERDPKHAEASETLYNAAVTYELGGSYAPAIDLLEQVRKRFPKSNAAAVALRRVGSLYAKVAWYELAAERYEEYANKFSGEKDADDVLSDAVFYRKGLGDLDQAIDDTKAYVARIAKDPTRAGDAADATYSLAALYERQGKTDDAIDQLRAYLKAYGKVSNDRTIAANARLGELLWNAACPATVIDGACVRVEKPKKNAPRTCGPTTAPVHTVVTRKAKLVAQATTALRAAADATAGDALAKYYRARATLLLADADYESYLGRAATTTDLDAWVAEQTRLAGELARRYEDVLAIGDPATAIAAAARIGQIYARFAEALYRAPKPSSDGDAFCDGVTAIADPVDHKAREAFEACLATSTKLGWFDDAARLCERELGRIDPRAYPALSEALGAAATTTFTTLAPALTRLEE